MLEISSAKLVRVIFLSREYGPESPQLYDYVSGFNEDEKINLVALMWIGRGSFAASDLEEAKQVAQTEATAPTEQYLQGLPGLAEDLESGMEALGIDVKEAEDSLRSY